jgi:hypothetical protein
LRDEKMAHFISLGGWLRGLEICAKTVELDFAPQRARVLAQPDLADYFGNELSTLPPGIAQTRLFGEIRAGVQRLRPLLSKSPNTLTPADVGAIRAQASELNNAIRQVK